MYNIPTSFNATSLCLHVSHIALPPPSSNSPQWTRETRPRCNNGTNYTNSITLRCDAHLSRGAWKLHTHATSLCEGTDGTSGRLIPDFLKIESRRQTKGKKPHPDTLKRQGFWTERQEFTNKTYYRTRWKEFESSHMLEGAICLHKNQHHTFTLMKS